MRGSNMKGSQIGVMLLRDLKFYHKGSIAQLTSLGLLLQCSISHKEITF